MRRWYTREELRAKDADLSAPEIDMRKIYVRAGEPSRLTPPDPAPITPGELFRAMSDLKRQVMGA